MAEDNRQYHTVAIDKIARKQVEDTSQAARLEDALYDLAGDPGINFFVDGDDDKTILDELVDIVDGFPEGDIDPASLLTLIQKYRDYNSNEAPQAALTAKIIEVCGDGIAERLAEPVQPVIEAIEFPQPAEPPQPDPVERVQPAPPPVESPEEPPVPVEEEPQLDPATESRLRIADVRQVFDDMIAAGEGVDPNSFGSILTSAVALATEHPDLHVEDFLYDEKRGLLCADSLRRMGSHVKDQYMQRIGEIFPNEYREKKNFGERLSSIRSFLGRAREVWSTHGPRASLGMLLDRTRSALNRARGRREQARTFDAQVDSRLEASAEVLDNRALIPQLEQWLQDHNVLVSAPTRIGTLLENNRAALESGDLSQVIWQDLASLALSGELTQSQHDLVMAELRTLTGSLRNLDRREAVNITIDQSSYALAAAINKILEFRGITPKADPEAEQTTTAEEGADPAEETPAEEQEPTLTRRQKWNAAVKKAWQSTQRWAKDKVARGKIEGKPYRKKDVAQALTALGVVLDRDRVNVALADKLQIAAYGNVSYDQDMSVAELASLLVAEMVPRADVETVRAIIEGTTITINGAEVDLITAIDEYQGVAVAAPEQDEQDEQDADADTEEDGDDDGEDTGDTPAPRRQWGTAVKSMLQRKGPKINGKEYYRKDVRQALEVAGVVFDPAAANLQLGDKLLAARATTSSFAQEFKPAELATLLATDMVTEAEAAEIASVLAGLGGRAQIEIAGTQVPLHEAVAESAQTRESIQEKVARLRAEHNERKQEAQRARERLQASGLHQLLNFGENPRYESLRDQLDIALISARRGADTADGVRAALAAFFTNESDGSIRTAAAYYALQEANAATRELIVDALDDAGFMVADVDGERKKLSVIMTEIGQLEEEVARLESDATIRAALAEVLGNPNLSLNKKRVLAMVLGGLTSGVIELSERVTGVNTNFVQLGVLPAMIVIAKQWVKNPAMLAYFQTRAANQDSWGITRQFFNQVSRLANWTSENADLVNAYATGVSAGGFFNMVDDATGFTRSAREAVVDLFDDDGDGFRNLFDGGVDLLDGDQGENEPPKPEEAAEGSGESEGQGAGEGEGLEGGEGQGQGAGEAEGTGEGTGGETEAGAEGESEGVETGEEQVVEEEQPEQPETVEGAEGEAAEGSGESEGQGAGEGEGLEGGEGQGQGAGEAEGSGEGVTVEGLMDTNDDGIPDARDLDGDGTPDEFDTNGDRKFDAVDIDGDGKPDQFDLDGDGRTDFVDTDGDNKPDEPIQSGSAEIESDPIEGGQEQVTYTTETHVVSDSDNGLLDVIQQHNPDSAASGSYSVTGEDGQRIALEQNSNILRTVDLNWDSGVFNNIEGLDQTEAQNLRDAITELLSQADAANGTPATLQDLEGMTASSGRSLLDVFWDATRSISPGSELTVVVGG